MKVYKIREFSKMIDVPPHTLRKWHDEGILVPDIMTPTGIRVYTEEQVDKYLRGEYSLLEYNDFYTIKEFSEKTGVPQRELKEWHDKGLLIPAVTSIVIRYSKEQVEKYNSGEYKIPLYKDYYRLSEFSREIGVSTDTLKQWHKKGILVPDVVTPIEVRYSSRQIEAYFHGEYGMSRDKKSDKE